MEGKEAVVFGDLRRKLKRRKRRGRGGDEQRTIGAKTGELGVCFFCPLAGC